MHRRTPTGSWSSVPPAFLCIEQNPCRRPGLRGAEPLDVVREPPTVVRDAPDVPIDHANPALERLGVKSANLSILPHTDRTCTVTPGTGAPSLTESVAERSLPCHSALPTVEQVVPRAAGLIPTAARPPTGERTGRRTSGSY
ncbi:hypothetical protein GCM10010377_38390 [Streptomyces viridiviolaceus]|nr:hypothetical protein GCM10010377_38390 [Streptomyces viridiviolaceus]